MGGFGVGYGRYYAGLGAYGAASSFGYPSRFGMYGGGFGGAYAGGDLSGYRRTAADESFGAPGNSGFGVGGDAAENFGGPDGSGFGGATYGGAYDPALGGYGSASTPDGNKGGFSGGYGRYHPYG
jgi:heterogeneous nuclear ribonucleoprotein A1/A3